MTDEERKDILAMHQAGETTLRIASFLRMPIEDVRKAIGETVAPVGIYQPCDSVKYYTVTIADKIGVVKDCLAISGEWARNLYEALAQAVPTEYDGAALINREGTQIKGCGCYAGLAE